MSLPRIKGETARLWAPPELRYTSSGKAVCTLPLVFNKRRKLPDGTWEDAGSLFVRATAWDQMAESCAECLDKGHDVIVAGELSLREYEKTDGSKGQSLELRLDDVGPSMRNATVKVTKAERGSTDDSPPF